MPYSSTRSEFGSTITQYPGNASAVTPSDSTPLTAGVALYVGTGGDVVVIPVDAVTNDPLTFKNVPSGSVLPVRVRQVLATNTTATDFIGVW